MDLAAKRCTVLLHLGYIMTLMNEIGDCQAIAGLKFLRLGLQFDRLEKQTLLC